MSEGGRQAPSGSPRSLTGFQARLRGVDGLSPFGRRAGLASAEPIDFGVIRHMFGHMVVVLDTDVIVAAVVSAIGASRFLLQEIGLGRLAAAASVPLLPRPSW